MVSDEGPSVHRCIEIVGITVLSKYLGGKKRNVAIQRLLSSLKSFSKSDQVLELVSIMFDLKSTQNCEDLKEEKVAFHKPIISGAWIKLGKLVLLDKDFQSRHSFSI